MVGDFSWSILKAWRCVYMRAQQAAGYRGSAPECARIAALICQILRDSRWDSGTHFAILVPAPAPACRFLREFSPAEPGNPASRIPGRSPYYEVAPRAQPHTSPIYTHTPVKPLMFHNWTLTLVPDVYKNTSLWKTRLCIRKSCQILYAHISTYNPV
jgi:hypothetical protein